MRDRVHLFLAGAMAVLVMGCQGGSSPGTAGTGGLAGGQTGGAGGPVSSGGTPGGSGGTPGGSGGAPSGSGGAGPSSGGTNGSGGAASGSGGRPTASGGASGGSPVTGGASGSGGTIGSGGSGGSTGTGGVASGGGGGAGSGGQAGSGVSGAGPGGRTASGGMGGGAATGGSTLLVPKQGALLGAFVGTGTMADLETTLGRKLGVVHNFFGWTDDYTGWVGSNLAAGYIPLATWETWTNNVGIPLDDIINGNHDTMIRARAQAAKALGKPFFLRWGHEMNGNWYPWDGSHNGGNAAGVAKYIATYHHIHDLFTAAGATNVLWVFCPNVDSVPGEAWNQWNLYYPGDAYADWVGFDGYNWGTVNGNSWRSFSAIASTIYAGLAALNKPIMIPETASAEQGGDKAAWIDAVLPALKGSFPGIKALVWFHMNKETDWRVDSSTASKNAFVPMANDPYFNP
ncbi:MAG TPA: glycosyl hydrolase [Polyangia bacterium]|jgi:hypothetical protein